MSYRIVGCHRRTGRERIAASGMTREEALARLETMRKDPLMQGFCCWIENEAAETRDDLGRLVQK